METKFAQALDALYVLLDQPAPLRDDVASGRHEIVVETRAGQLALRLSVSPNERSLLVQSTDGPRFAVDAALRERQFGSVLQTALGLAATNCASVGMEPVPGEVDGMRLGLQARVPLSMPRNQIGAALKAAIEDLIEQAEWQGAHLEAQGLPATSSGARGRPAPAPEEFIFRP